jgi:hypothetical protein
MGDTIELGYQAALVSLHSPTYGRLWLANELHPGDTVSMTRTQALVSAHDGQTDVVADLAGWFHTYNGRQTIEAGIKEGKNVFQMHHLKVCSPEALLLQEQMACFAANFVRFAGHWLTQAAQPTPFSTQSVKQMVQVTAHTSAWVQRQGDVCLLTFTEQSCYAGHSLRFGNGVIQLPLPLVKDFHFSHF